MELDPNEICKNCGWKLNQHKRKTLNCVSNRDGRGWMEMETTFEKNRSRKTGGKRTKSIK
jgi:hypothetical protein